jgi:hypothetical protein
MRKLKCYVLFRWAVHQEVKHWNVLQTCCYYWQQRFTTSSKRFLAPAWFPAANKYLCRKWIFISRWQLLGTSLPNWRRYFQTEHGPHGGVVNRREQKQQTPGTRGGTKKQSAPRRRLEGCRQKRNAASPLLAGRLHLTVRLQNNARTFIWFCI